MEKSDARPVAELLAACFEGALHPYIVYCQPGVAAYLSVMMDIPARFPDHHLYVASDADADIVGFAEFRNVSSSGCVLSYIGVSEAERGLGLAEQLIDGYLHAHPAITSIDLDVFAGNQAAHRLYNRLGFHAITTTWWWHRSLPDPLPHDPALQLFDWHASAASLEQYGFCRIRATYHSRKLTLGLTSRTVLRVWDLAEFADDDLLGALRFVVPDADQVFIVGQDSNEPTSDSRPVVTSCRLHAAAATIRASLG